MFCHWVHILFVFMLSRFVMFCGHSSMVSTHYVPSFAPPSFNVLVLKYYSVLDPLNVTPRGLVFMSRYALYDSSDVSYSLFVTYLTVRLLMIYPRPLPMAVSFISWPKKWE